MIRRNILLKLAAVLFAATVIYLWQIAADARLISPVFFPSPTRTFAAFLAMEERGDVWRPMAATALRMFYGWVLASCAGIILGAAIARSGPIRAYLEPLLEFLRPLPASAIIPPAILFLGLTSKMAVSVIAFGALWPVLLGSYHGFRSVEPQLAEMAAAMRMTSPAFLWKVALPSALPDIFAGVRVSLAIALILAVVTEMQAAQTGLGFNILMAQRSFRSPELFAGIIVLGVLGLFTNLALVRTERYLLRWRTVTR
ncbi:MAG TPA: ABC transporter permease [Stellaceae bacterium]|jgi:ABC-type nitrate/sulfonate/bicarbonate transport system permease component|nr:ABC transporter permease [Stellaceae bacterium]